MSMMLNDFQDEIRENVKRDTNGLANSRITRWLNWAKDYLADLHTYKEMKKVYTFNTVASNSLPIPWNTNMKDLYSMTVQDGARSRKLIYVNARDFDDRIPRMALFSNNLPEYYVDYGSNFELFPIPDAAYQVRARVSEYPVDLSGSTDTCTLLRKDALLTAMATTFGFWSLREIEDAAYWGREIVAPLYEASLIGEPKAEDWIPIARGFGIQREATLVGNWWENPFTGRAVP